MKKRNFVIASILAGSLFSVAAVGVANACNGHRGGHGGRMMHMLNKLDLTEKQTAAIRSIKSEQKAQTQATRDKIKDLRNALREQTKTEKFDSAKVHELANAKAKLMVAMMVKRVETMHRIRKELTPEQAAKFNSMRDHKFKSDKKKSS